MGRVNLTAKFSLSYRSARPQLHSIEARRSSATSCPSRVIYHPRLPRPPHAPPLVLPCAERAMGTASQLMCVFLEAYIRLLPRLRGLLRYLPLAIPAAQDPPAYPADPSSPAAAPHSSTYSFQDGRARSALTHPPSLVQARVPRWNAPAAQDLLGPLEHAGVHPSQLLCAAHACVRGYARRPQPG